MPRPVLDCCQPFHYQGGSGRVHWMHARHCDRFPRVQVGHEPKRPTSCAWHSWAADYLTSEICNGRSCVAYREAHVDDDLIEAKTRHPSALSVETA